eukprot:GDKI01035508.1.p1 GENE.GDKI01035508.1~~GDKI01035508.1.p1  ORF type:complete len:2344 (-),score=543.67 GDKI01035508.1:388-6831(-)
MYQISGLLQVTDACGGTCTKAGFRCSTTGQCNSICGDGKVTDVETCDDGNTLDGDGCSKSCTVEPGWKCTAQTASGSTLPGPSKCGPDCPTDASTLPSGVYLCAPNGKSSALLTKDMLVSCTQCVASGSGAITQQRIGCPYVLDSTSKLTDTFLCNTVTTPNPVGTALLTDNFLGLSIKFDPPVAISRALFGGSITASTPLGAPGDCTVLFAKEDVDTFGTKAVCSWSSAKSVYVQLGTGATVVSGDALTLKGGVLQRQDAVRDLPAATPWTTAQSDISVSLDPTVFRPTPSIVLEGPSTVSKCADVVISGGKTTGAAGRVWKSLMWSCSVPDTTEANNGVKCPTAVDDALTEASKAEKQLLTVRLTGAQLSSAVPVGVSSGTLQFKLEATNFLDIAGTPAVFPLTIQATKRFPTISVVGSPTITIRQSEPLRMEVGVVLPPATCDGSEPTPDQKDIANVTWSVQVVSGSTDTPETIIAQRLFSNPPRYNVFRLDGGKLDSGAQYIFTARGFASKSKDTYVESAFSVSVEQDIPPVLNVAGPPGWTVSESCPFRIDASRSYDAGVAGDGLSKLGTPAKNVNFGWACKENAGGGSCFDSAKQKLWDAVVAASNGAAANFGQLLVPAELFTAGQSYVLTITVTSKNTQLTTSDEYTLTVSDNAPVAAVLKAVPTSLSTQLPLSLEASIEQSDTCKASVSAAWLLYKLPTDLTDTTTEALTASLVANGLDFVGKLTTSTTSSALTGTTTASKLRVLGSLPPAVLSANTRYLFVLNLNAEEDTTDARPTSQDVSDGKVVLASNLLLANGPPQAGTVTVTPTSGQALIDKFSAYQSGWTDSDLPLAYAFAISDQQSEAEPTVLKDWGAQPDVSDLSLRGPSSGESVLYVVYGKVRDTMGGVSTATSGTVTVRLPDSTIDTTAASNQLNNVIDSLDTADDAQVLSMVSGLASVQAGQASQDGAVELDDTQLEAQKGLNAQMLSTLDTVFQRQASDGALSTNAVSQQSGALRDAVVAAVSTKSADPSFATYTMDVAAGAIVNANSDAASTGAVGSFLDVMDVVVTTGLSDSPTKNGGRRLTADEAEALSQKVTGAVDTLGGLYSSSVPIGSSQTLTSAGGLALTVGMSDVQAAATSGVSVQADGEGGAAATLPPLANSLAAGLPPGGVCADGSDANVATQAVSWPKNPYGYSEQSANTSSTVVSLDVKACGNQKIKVENLPNNATIVLPVDVTALIADSNAKRIRRLASDQEEGQRVTTWEIVTENGKRFNKTTTNVIKTETQPHCGWWDETNSEWSTEGCYVGSTTGGLECLCDHLTDFGAVLVDTAISVFEDSNLSVLDDFGAAAEGLRVDNPAMWIAVFITLVSLILMVQAILYDRKHAISDAKLMRLMLGAAAIAKERHEFPEGHTWRAYIQGLLYEELNVIKKVKEFWARLCLTKKSVALTDLEVIRLAIAGKRRNKKNLIAIGDSEEHIDERTGVLMNLQFAIDTKGKPEDKNASKNLNKLVKSSTMHRSSLLPPSDGNVRKASQVVPGVTGAENPRAAQFKANEGSNPPLAGNSATSPSQTSTGQHKETAQTDEHGGFLKLLKEAVLHVRKQKKQNMKQAATRIAAVWKGNAVRRRLQREKDAKNGLLQNDTAMEKGDGAAHAYRRINVGSQRGGGDVEVAEHIVSVDKQDLSSVGARVIGKEHAHDNDKPDTHAQPQKDTHTHSPSENALRKELGSEWLEMSRVNDTTPPPQKQSDDCVDNSGVHTPMELEKVVSFLEKSQMQEMEMTTLALKTDTETNPEAQTQTVDKSKPKVAENKIVTVKTLTDGDDAEIEDPHLDQFMNRVQYTEWSILTLFVRSLVREHPVGKAAIESTVLWKSQRLLGNACAFLGSAMLIAVFIGRSEDPSNAVIIIDFNLTISLGGSDPVSLVLTLNAVLAAIFAWVLSQPFPYIVEKLFEAAVRSPVVRDHEIKPEYLERVKELQAALETPVSTYDMLVDTQAAMLRMKALKASTPGVCLKDHVAKRWLREVQMKRAFGFILAAAYVGFCLYFFWMFALVRGPAVMELLVDFLTGNVLQILAEQAVFPLITAVALALFIRLLMYTTFFDRAINVAPDFVDFSEFDGWGLDGKQKEKQTGDAETGEGEKGDKEESEGDVLEFEDEPLEL